MPLRLLVVVTLLGVLAACGDDDPAPTEPTPTEQDTSAAQPPVVLVPGLGGSPTDMALIANALEDDGRTTVTVDNQGGTADLREQAALVDEAVRGTGAEEVDVVGFSAGGIVARLWATGDGADAVRRLVTIGAPHHGTTLEALEVSDPADCTDACAQLLAGSDLLEELDATGVPADADWVSIWSDSDGVVDPAESARLDGALDVNVQAVCGDLELRHLDLLGHPVPDLVAAVLDGEEAVVPDASACDAG
ncbi:alpha/beta fold hydrolase [Nocardioides sp. MAH-18]|uniref:Alpha/beta fold hydrolase n=1 Tax=Nocardioides agri TaxID=2682843 RepID=A0A6L6XW59_9ACTN|nr:MULTISPECIES: alpha/beta fold hydrolase [unclassified Nocardioides]MBA2952288.1 alpha/beta fold hydrolase [Nocardioides sp. CGMCC 1.13656]MVQ51450.1 alpha/beta fold hydrolase [Nocardioides sp. MAH-18]